MYIVQLSVSVHIPRVLFLWNMTTATLFFWILKNVWLLVQQLIIQWIGIFQRRWIVVSNPSLCALLSKWLGTEAWIRNADLLTGLRDHVDNTGFRHEWKMVIFLIKFLWIWRTRYDMPWYTFMSFWYCRLKGLIKWGLLSTLKQWVVWRFVWNSFTKTFILSFHYNHRS